MKTMTSLIVRKKNDPTAPLITSTPETVDLDSFDVVNEHGTPVGDDVLAEIRKMQAPPEPPLESGKAPLQHAPHVPPHVPQPQHVHDASSKPQTHEPSKKR